MEDHRFSWTDVKAASNVRDHGVAFEVAKGVFDDQLRIDEPNEHEERHPFEGLEEWMDDEPEDEEARSRWQTIGSGRSDGGTLLFVVYALRKGEDDKTRIHIISARKANPDEQHRYDTEVR